MSKSKNATLNQPTVSNDIEDMDLEFRVATALRDQGRATLERIRVDVTHGIITLRGVVSSNYERQLCISCCNQLDGVVGVVDEIEVTASHVAATS